MSKDLITIKQAANILEVHPLTVYRMVSRGELQGFKTAGKREILVSRKTVEQLREPQPVMVKK